MPAARDGEAKQPKLVWGGLGADVLGQQSEHGRGVMGRVISPGWQPGAEKSGSHDPKSMGEGMARGLDG